VREILDKYQPEMHAIADVLVAGKKPAVEGEPQPVDRNVVERMNAMFDDIDAEMATVLDAEQLALYRAVTDPDFSDVEAMLQPANVDASQKSPNTTQGYTENCFYSPYYQAYAKLYAYAGYIYAYYSYYYNSSDYGYTAYLFGTYSYAYNRLALDYSGPCYFGAYYTGSISVEDGYTYAYWADYYADESEYYAYNAYHYSYADYYYYSTENAYYSYIYNYNAYIYADNANYYAHYCYLNW
jgi:hypothetical protein